MESARAGEPDVGAACEGKLVCVVRPAGVVRPDGPAGVEFRDGLLCSGLSGDLPKAPLSIILMLTPPEDDDDPSAFTADEAEDDPCPSSGLQREVCHTR